MFGNRTHGAEIAVDSLLASRLTGFCGSQLPSYLIKGTRHRPLLRRSEFEALWQLEECLFKSSHVTVGVRAKLSVTRNPGEGAHNPALLI